MEFFFYNLAEFVETPMPGFEVLDEKTGKELVEVNMRQAFDLKKFKNDRWNLFIDIA